MKRFVVAALLASPLAACADGDRSGFYEANVWALTAANPAGPPVNCVEQLSIRGHVARDDQTIDFQMNDGSVLRNRLPNACPGLRRNNRFVYRTALNRLCSVDLITVLETNGSTGASCGLGVFQPIVVPPRAGTAPETR
jgi:hypothetical protein